MPRRHQDEDQSAAPRRQSDGLARHGVHLTFGPDPASSMIVSWITRSPVLRPEVRLRPAPIDDTATATDAATATATDTAAGTGTGIKVDAVTRSYTDAVTRQEIFAHHALLEGLEPDTEYRYEISMRVPGNAPFRHRGSGRLLELGGSTFRTAPSGRTAFSFTCFGDHGTDHPEDPFGTAASATLVAGIERVAPLFTLVNGDLAYANVNAVPPVAWSGWFEMISASAHRRPWMPSAGNHEIERGNGALGLAAYQTYFQLPSNDDEPYLDGLWYAFTVGGVRFVVLSGDDVCYQDAGRVYLHGYSSGRQTAWLERELKQARADRDVDWIVAVAHQPAISTAAHHNGADLGLREEWLPLFDQYGVDLVLSGHEHHYERTHPLRGVIEGTPTRTPRPVPAAATTENGALTIDTSAGAVHLLVGTGGSSTPSAHELFDPPACQVVVGVRDPAPGQRHHPAIREMESAPWLAARFPDHPYAFAGFEVDPGTPGGTTRIVVTVYDSSTAEPVPFDTFTLVRPRGDADGPWSPALDGV
ncbi:metallophosphoesterase family protein [Frankia sp. R43]|uniref:purple acid phosphatase family protein n=1 Tax=Frankia sp. R43 TaxID=269536 RepID=UPI0009F95FC8|nr:metallophosphoesterase family protein [Frankia sp. R43]